MLCERQVMVDSVSIQLIDDGMTSTQLFEVLGNMLGELRDGHASCLFH